jgi:hypothetical protein
MELKWSHYCMDVLPHGWGVDLFYTLAGFGADPGKSLELPDLPVHLGVRLHAPPDTPPDGHVLQATIKGNSGKVLSPTQSVPLDFKVLPAGYPVLGLGKVPLKSWAPLPSIGRHEIDLAVDGTPIGHVPFVIQQRSGKFSEIQSREAPGLQLRWAHLVHDVKSDQAIPGILSMGGIFEFLPADERTNSYNLKGALLLLQIESDLTIHTKRALRAELLDSNGEAAREPSGRLRTPPMSRPITLRRLSPNWDFLVSTATVRFEQDLWLTPGQYRFRFSIDEQPFGDPLELTVVPSHRN